MTNVESTIDMLKKILMSEEEYWIVARKETAREYGHTVRLKDLILFIAIPHETPRNLKYEELTVAEVEKLDRAYIEQNIPINSSYPPFQRGITLYDVYEGYPIRGALARQMLIEALALHSDEIYDYKNLIEKLEAQSVGNRTA